MIGSPRLQQRKLRQIKYLLRKLLPKNRAKLSSARRQDLENRFKKAYARRSWLPLSRKLQQAALALAVTLGVQQADAQVSFATPVISPYGINLSNSTVFSGDLVDLDGDGDLDFVYGGYYYNYGGSNNGVRLYYQQNIGTAAVPNFSAPVSSPFGIAINASAVICAPQFADLDGDGDQDLILSAYSPYTTFGVQYYENTGTATAPAFGPVVANAFGIGLSGTFPTLNLPDIDADGDVDLFFADSYYSNPAALNYQPNTGTATAPAFGAVQSNAFLPTSPFPAGSTATFVDFVDLDGDGDLDMITSLYNYSTYTNQVGYFPNTGTATAPTFGPFVSGLYNLLLPASVYPLDLVFGDLDGDGDEDLLLFDRYGGGYSGYGSLLYYENNSPLGTLPTINFDSTNLTVNEGAGTVDVDLHLSNAYPGALSVDINALAASTATNGTDFSFMGGSTVTFAANDTVETVTIPIVDDAVVEGTEQFALGLSNPTGGAMLGANDTVLVDILDNDFGAPIINFGSSNYSQNEAGGNVNISVTITNPSSSPTSVDVSIGTTSTADLSDVVYVNPATLTFGGNASTPLTLSVPVVDDALFEGDEYLVLRLSNVTNGGSAGMVDSTHVTIVDNEAMPTVEFLHNVSNVNEGAGTALVRLDLSGPVQGMATVELDANPTSTATNGADYTLTLPQTVSFVSGNTSAIIIVPIVDDNLPEGAEEISLDISAPSSNIGLGIFTNTRVIIRDNDSIINVNHLAQAGHIEAYPNPFSEHLTIELEQPQGKALRVVNSLGLVVLDRSVTGRQMQLKTAALPAGTYWVQVYDPKTGAALWQQRLVRQ